MVAIWSDYTQSPHGQSTVFQSPITDFCSHNDLIATCSKDVISLFRNLKQVHSIKCNTNVSTIMWSKCGGEFVSTHEDPNFEVKLWQIDKALKDGCELWFTKVKDFEECHESKVIKTLVSPSGEYVCTLSSDETIALWKFFPKFKR